ncbi:sigma factor [Sorangium sp. So ce269]
MSDLNDEELRALLPGMRRFAASLTRDASAADDLVQGCLERTLSRWRTKRPEGSLKAWMYAIMYRQFLDSRRRAGRDGYGFAVVGRADDPRIGEVQEAARLAM